MFDHYQADSPYSDPRRTGSRAAAIAVTLLVFGSARSAETVVLEEVTVTARKVSETLQDVPLTITAFKAAQLEERGIQDVKGLAAFTPGLWYTTPEDRSYGSFQIRGMSQTTGIGDTSRDLVSVFIDGVYYAGATPELTFEDLDHVEVVKGPQSALFGRATFGGAINFVTAAPGNTFKGSVTGRVGQYSDDALGFSIEGPLIEDKLAARLTGNFWNYGGQYTNADGGGSLGAQREKFAALALAFTPVESLKGRLRFSYTRDDDGAPAVQLVDRLPDHNCGPFGGTNDGGPATLYCGPVEFSGQPALVPSLPPLGLGKFGFDDPGLRRDYDAGSLNLDWTLPASFTLSFLGGWQQEHLEAVEDFTRTDEDVWWSDSLRAQQATSEELRLTSPQDGKLHWLAGLYHLRQNYYTAGNFMVGTANPYSFFPGFYAGAVIDTSPNRQTIENKAGFASITYDVIEPLKLSLEGRFQKDTITEIEPAGPPQILDTNKFLPRFIADYRLNRNVKFYFDWAKGDQPTTGNADVLQLSPAHQAIAASLGLLPVVPEAQVTNWEFGTKTTWNDDRVIADAAVYLLQWRGKQGVKQFQIDFNGNGVIDLGATGANQENFNAQAYEAGDENITGIDLDLRSFLTDRLQVGLALGASHLHILRLEDSTYQLFFGTLDASHQQEGLVPRANGTLFAEYRQPVAPNATAFLRTDLTYVGRRYDSILDEAYVPATTKVNLKSGVDWNSLNLTLYVDNLFDNRTVQSAFFQGDSATDPFRFLPASDEVVLAQKRQVGITFKYRF
jgi:iron complex outermembrane receptor protein